MGRQEVNFVSVNDIYQTLVIIRKLSSGSLLLLMIFGYFVVDYLNLMPEDMNEFS